MGLLDTGIPVDPQRLKTYFCELKIWPRLPVWSNPVSGSGDGDSGWWEESNLKITGSFFLIYILSGGLLNKRKKCPPVSDVCESYSCGVALPQLFTNYGRIVIKNEFDDPETYKRATILHFMKILSFRPQI